MVTSTMIKLRNPEAPATKRQLWLLHILTKTDTRNLDITMDEANQRIRELKSGICDAVQSNSSGIEAESNNTYQGDDNSGDWEGYYQSLLDDKGWLSDDPIASYRIDLPVTRIAKLKDGTMAQTTVMRQVGLEFFISLTEQDFLEYFTVKQAKIINPHQAFTKYLIPGTPHYNHVPRDVVLDEIAEKFHMTADEIAERIENIRRIKQGG